MAKKKPGLESKLCAAALHLAARQGWNRVTLEAIAKTAKTSLPQIKKLYPNTDDLLPAIVHMIDQEMFTLVDETDTTVSPHDRLFEIIMARVDVLQNHRAGILAIMDALRRNPRLLQKLVPAHVETMRGILKHTKLMPSKLHEPLAIAGLMALWGASLFTWRSDSSADLSRTMAGLDRNLKRLGMVAEFIFRAKPRL